MCTTISTSFGTAIPWVDKVKYLGIFIVHSHTFRCDPDHATNRSTALLMQFLEKLVVQQMKEEVMVQLLVSKCMPILMYGLEACPPD